MSDGVLLWSVGLRHREHFITCLLSLRDHWTHGVAVVVGDRAARDLAESCRARFDLRIIDFDYAALTARHRRNSHYLAKTYLCDKSPFDRTVFVDLDTLTCGDIDPVFPEDGEIVLTRFAEWTTNAGPHMPGRVGSWANVCPYEAKLMLRKPYPAINTGVFGFDRDCGDFMREWQRTTEKNVVFMADELAAQLMYIHFRNRVLDDRFNWSVVYSKDNEDARVRHGHGFKFFKKDRGWSYWRPYFARACAENIAGIADWERSKHLRNRLELELSNG